MNGITLGVATQPAFLISQTLFVLASGVLVSVGVFTGRVSGADAFVAVVIPSVALLAVMRIYRRLHAVTEERAFDASDGLLADMIPVMESIALLGLGAIVF